MACPPLTGVFPPGCPPGPSLCPPQPASISTVTPKVNRTITQLVSVNNTDLVALCSDGTLWYLAKAQTNNQWAPVNINAVIYA